MVFIICLSWGREDLEEHMIFISEYLKVYRGKGGRVGVIA